MLMCNPLNRTNKFNSSDLAVEYTLEGGCQTITHLGEMLQCGVLIGQITDIFEQGANMVVKQTTLWWFGFEHPT